MTAHDPRQAARPNAPTTTYLYDAYDAAFVRERVAEFRAQVARRLTGAMTDTSSRPFRLMNGLYLQLARLYATRRHPLRDADLAANACPRRHRR